MSAKKPTANLREAATQALVYAKWINEEQAIISYGQMMNLRAALANTPDWDEIKALRASLREHMAEIHRLRAAGRQALEALENPWSAGPNGVADAIHALCAAFEPVTDCHEKEGDKLPPPLAWYDPSNGVVSTDKDDPRFTPLGQLWPLYRSADTGKTSDHIPDAGKMVASVREDRTVEATIKQSLIVEPVATSQESRQVELVAHIVGYKQGYCVIEPVDRNALLPVGMALYRSPPKREPLKNEEIDFLIQLCTKVSNLRHDSKNDISFADKTVDLHRLVREVEKMHGIGGEE